MVVAGAHAHAHRSIHHHAHQPRHRSKVDAGELAVIRSVRPIARNASAVRRALAAPASDVRRGVAVRSVAADRLHPRALTTPVRTAGPVARVVGRAGVAAAIGVAALNAHGAYRREGHVGPRPAKHSHAGPAAWR
ncbi:MAG: hypothetical protein JWM86_744, partial [Thermoleophilia bacterium]|nr:hypothetical protein [Thermoleophilia bacterium]